MRISFLPMIVGLFVVTCASSPDNEEARVELRRLEQHLDVISVGDDPLWLDKLQIAADLKLKNEKIRQVQKMCVSAYREYASAAEEMAIASKQLDKLEKSVAAGNTEGLAAKQVQTQQAISETSRHLLQSQTLIRSCMNARMKLKDKLQLVRM